MLGRLEKIHRTAVHRKNFLFPIENDHTFLHIFQNHGNGISILLDFPKLAANCPVLMANFNEERLQLVITSRFRQGFQIIGCFGKGRNNPLGYHSGNKHAGNKQNSTGKQIQGENLKEYAKNISVIPS